MAGSDLSKEAAQCLRRLEPSLQPYFNDTTDKQKPSKASWKNFQARLIQHWPVLFDEFTTLYRGRYDAYYHLEKLLHTMAQSWTDRPPDLRKLDKSRDPLPNHYLKQNTVGGALYVDLFSENLPKFKTHIPYFKNLGITYLHLMPLFAVRPGENDGGYAVSNYRSLDPNIGNIEDLTSLSKALRKEGISLVVDFVLNHTADDHEWALKARAGDPDFEAFYFIYPDRTVPDQFEKNLREIFPTIRRGNFTWDEGMKKWIWTTFNSYQWDLNYHNPDVLRTMAEEMLFLANAGVEVLRLDAVAFVWKQMGTSCENLPQAHQIIRLLNVIKQISAPSLKFKSEAIVAPKDVLKYISPKECSLSYNPMLMALLWEALATRKTELLTLALQKHFNLPDECTWANYLRCHDDIGWTFEDEDAQTVGINPYEHRQFLNAFYTGQFPGSFARGVPFQHNPETNDMRISGTLASLAGLEQALETGNDDWIEMAKRRIILLRSVIMSIGGFPLIYLGEEWGLLNDYSYVSDPAKSGDSRWVHRPKMRWEYLDDLNAPNSVTKKINDDLINMVKLRQSTAAFSGSKTTFHNTGNPIILSFSRYSNDQHVLVLVNFSEEPQEVDNNFIRLNGKSNRFKNLLDDKVYETKSPLRLESYQFTWLTPANR